MDDLKLDIPEEELSDFLQWVEDEGVSTDIYVTSLDGIDIPDETDKDLQETLLSFTHKLIAVIKDQLLGRLEIRIQDSFLTIGVNSYVDKAGPVLGYQDIDESTHNFMITYLGTSFYIHREEQRIQYPSGMIYISNDGVEVGYQQRIPDNPGAVVSILFDGPHSIKGIDEFTDKIGILMRNDEAIDRVIELLESLGQDRLWREALSYILESDDEDNVYHTEHYNESDVLKLITAAPEHLLTDGQKIAKENSTNQSNGSA